MEDRLLPVGHIRFGRDDLAKLLRRRFAIFLHRSRRNDRLQHVVEPGADNHDRREHPLHRVHHRCEALDRRHAHGVTNAPRDALGQQHGNQRNRHRDGQRRSKRAVGESERPCDRAARDEVRHDARERERAMGTLPALGGARAAAR